ncbi:MAG: DUF1570 domain-containing protein [bacterium]|nr:DUF1570 domain-containing protein [bacterium]
MEVRTPHFVVLSNASKRHARETAEHFEQIRTIFAQALPASVEDSGQPLRVFAVSGERTLRQLLPQYWESRDRAKPAGTFRSLPTSSQIVVRADLVGGEDYGTVYHEYFHFLASGTRLELPAWVDEGLATYWGSTRLTPKKADVGRPDVPRLDILRAGPLLPLETMMTVDRSSPHYSRIDKKQKFYAQSWALIHFLLLGDGSAQGTEQLAAYLRLLGEGKEGVEAATQAFGDLQQLRSKLQAYIRKLLFPYVELPVPAPPRDEQIVMRELPRGEASALAALYVLEGRRTHGVEDLVAVATERAPNLAATHTAVGLLHTWRREYSEALAAFELAVGQADSSPLTHYALAAVRLHGDQTPESLGIAEQHLARAIALDQDFAPARARLADVLRRKDGCSEQALAHLRAAQAIQPRSLLYRLKEAEIRHQCGEAEVAIRVVEKVVAEASASASSAENNNVCWYGSFWGLVDEVLPACDRAVELTPERFGPLDSRGVARAISGDLDGAVADLRAALELAGDDWNDEAKALRASWVRGLGNGVNPFAGDRLKELRDDPDLQDLGWGH